jgi:hypothetical protein
MRRPAITDARVVAICFDKEAPPTECGRALGFEADLLPFFALGLTTISPRCDATSPSKVLAFSECWLASARN